MTGDPRSIGVFDSGIGGLTVVRELRRRLPNENIIYFGDTARVPYGTKSTTTVTQFSREICHFLMGFDPKVIVVACNTASAVALGDLASEVSAPIYGVVEPGARRAVEAADGGVIAVIATEATINSDAYRRAITQIKPSPRVTQRACPLFVPLVEEGRACDDPITLLVVREYLSPVLKVGPKVMVLGCTHYPLIKDAIATVAGPDILLVDSGEQTARTVAEKLTAQGALSTSDKPGSLSCYVSDNPQRFREIGQRFLGHPITDVTWVPHEQLLTSHAAAAHQ